MHQNDKYIKENYLTKSQRQMAKEIGRSKFYVSSRMKVLKLELPAEILQERLQKNKYGKGHYPFNKGKKITEFMTKEQVAKFKANQFKKGQLPHNTKTNGTISVRTDKAGRKIKWIRISKRNWERLHILNWITTNGPIPKGYVVAFKTTDTMNAEVSNLKLITMEENMNGNSIHRYPEELKSTIRVLSKLKKTLQNEPT